MKQCLLWFLLILPAFLAGSCFLDSPKQPLVTEPVQLQDSSMVALDDVAVNGGTMDAEVTVASNSDTVQTGKTSADDLVAYAKTLIGIPYKYGSARPDSGFDCSGFITYVFNHFGIAVPRSSVAFTQVGRTVPLQEARPGDLILFTGTQAGSSVVGHMGIVTENADSVRFIHSTSGRQYGVVVSAVTPQYQKRFVRVARVFSP